MIHTIDLICKAGVSAFATRAIIGGSGLVSSDLLRLVMTCEEPTTEEK